MSLQEQRKKLAEQKAANNRLITQIQEKLNAIITAEQRNSRIDYNKEKSFLAAFSNREEVVRLFIAKGGEDYFTARLENEKAFAGFASEYLTVLTQLEATVTAKSFQPEARTSLLGTLESLSKSWHETKSSEWRKTIMDSGASVLKSGLISIIDQTKTDIENFIEAASTLTGENTTNARERSVAVMAKLDEFRAALTTAHIADTQGNLESIKKIREKLEYIRSKLTARASNHAINAAMKELTALIEKAKVGETSGKKLTPKDTIDAFPTTETLRQGKTDELTSAVFVLRQLNMSEEFFTEMDSSLKAKELPPFPEVYVAETDPAYTVFNDKLIELATLGKAAAERRDAATVAGIKQSIDMIKRQQATVRAVKTKKYQDELSKYNAALAQYLKESPLKKILDKIKQVATLFTGDDMVPYSKRAEIMIKHNVYDFESLLDRYISAATDRDSDTMDMLNAKFNSMIQAYNVEKALLGADEVTAIPITETELTPDSPITIDLPEVDLDDASALFDGILGTPEPEKKESAVNEGDVEKVNTEPEKKDPFLSIIDSI